MTFPVVANTVNSGSSAASTTLVVSLPSLIAGDWLVIDLSINVSGTPTVPTGWTQVAGRVGATFSDFVYSRKCDGTEGASVSITSPSAKFDATARRISGADTSTPIEAGTFSSAIGATTITAPAYSPSWGSADTLWLLHAHGSTVRTVNTWPTGFTGDQQTTSTSAAGVVASATKNDTTATETPTALTWSGSTSGVSVLLAIKPAAAAAAVTESQLERGTRGVARGVTPGAVH